MVNSDYLVTVTTVRNDDSDTDEKNSIGLIEGNVYSVISEVFVNGENLFVVKNPWQNDKSFNGTWKEDSPNWA